MRLKLMDDEEALELQDILDRMHCAPGEAQIGFEFCDWQSDYMPLRSLYEQTFRADISDRGTICPGSEANAGREQAVKNDPEKDDGVWAHGLRYHTKARR